MGQNIQAFLCHSGFTATFKIAKQLDMIKITCYGETDVGVKRTNNEDAIIVKPDLYFLAVADGMGGQASGEVASSTFADTTLEVFSKSGNRSEQETLELIQKSFILANERVLGKAMENPEQHGMGCTGELIAFYQQNFVVGHVGDSRTYLFRQGKMKQITQDHSFVQELIHKGVITEEEAKSHARRNVILRAIGVKEELPVDIIKGECLTGDLYLLCSDGLTGMVDDVAIENTLSNSGTLPEKTKQLIGSAKSAGGKDNITVALCEIL